MEKRPDLAALEVNPPEGYLFDKIFPAFRVGTPAGKFYYHDIQSDVTAQTDRTAGNAPTTVIIGEANVDYDAGEAIYRARAPYEKLKVLRGRENAEKICAKITKRSVMKSKEADCVAEVFGATENSPIVGTDGSFLTDIETAKNAVKRAEGLGLYLVGGSDAINFILNIAEVTNAMLRATGGILPAQVYAPSTLASILMIDGVWVGDRAMWGQSGANDYRRTAALIVAPRPEEEAVFTEAQLGRSLVYYDNEDELEIESSDNDESRGVDVDAISQYDIQVLNPEAIQVLQNLDGEVGYWPTTTTTTTT